MSEQDIFFGACVELTQKSNGKWATAKRLAKAADLNVEAAKEPILGAQPKTKISCSQAQATATAKSLPQPPANEAEGEVPVELPVPPAVTPAQLMEVPNSDTLGSLGLRETLSVLSLLSCCGCGSLPIKMQLTLKLTLCVFSSCLCVNFSFACSQMQGCFAFSFVHAFLLQVKTRMFNASKPIVRWSLQNLDKGCTRLPSSCLLAKASCA